jgi:hypothetical protein
MKAINISENSVSIYMATLCTTIEKYRILNRFTVENLVLLLNKYVLFLIYKDSQLDYILRQLNPLSHPVLRYAF